MLNKVYLIVFAVFVLPMAFLTYYAGTWLGSIGAPVKAAESYFYFTSFGWTLLWGSFFVLLILANIILWSSRKAWAIWLSFLYFAFFIFLRYWYLEGSYLDFARRNGFTDSNFSTGPLVAMILVVGIGALVFFDQFVVLRLNEKMHPLPKEIETGDDSNVGEVPVDPPIAE